MCGGVSINEDLFQNKNGVHAKDNDKNYAQNDAKNDVGQDAGPGTAVTNTSLGMFSPPLAGNTVKPATEKNKLSSRRARAKAGKLPSRPKTAWQLFGADFIARYKAQNHLEQIANHAEVYRLQGMAWQKLSKRGKTEIRSAGERRR